jgi:PKD repeat protein
MEYIPITFKRIVRIYSHRTHARLTHGSRDVNMRGELLVMTTLLLALLFIFFNGPVVKAEAPVILIDYPLEGAEYRANELIELNASDSYDPEGKSLTYFWKDNNDGSLGGGAVLHVHLTPGGHTITCEVTDGDNEKASTSRHITVKQIYPPVAHLEVDKNDVKVLEIVAFSAAKSTDPSMGIVSFYFDFGDGFNSGWMTSSGTSHSYDAPKIYTAKLTVKNVDGKTDSAFVNITVRPKTHVEDNTTPPNYFMVALVSALVIIIIILIVAWRRISIRANREARTELDRKLRNPSAYRMRSDQYPVERQLPPEGGQATKVRQPVMKEPYPQSSGPRKIKAPLQRGRREP